MNHPTNSRHDVPDNDLSRHLARRAAEFDRRGGGPLELGQVLDRAGEIRRGRRMRATIVMAAAVLAVAVPGTLLVTGNDSLDKPVSPAKQAKVDRSPITLDGLKTGDEPRVGYLDGRTWRADGSTVELAAKGSVRAVAPLGAAFLVETDIGDGELRATVVPTPPDFVGQETTWPAEGGLARSGEGDSAVAAFVQPDGTPVVVQDGGRVSVELPRIPRGSGFTALAAFGPDCSAHLDVESCGVWVSSRGENPESWESWSSGRVSPLTTGLHTVVAAGADGALAAGVTEVHDDLTSCSAVESLVEERTLWSTCDHDLVAFSPDAHRMLAEAQGDGRGPTGLAVYGDDGSLLLDLEVAHDGYVRQMVWEDDTHVLATVYEDGQWAVVRIGMGGARELAVPPVRAVDDVDPPFLLPAG